MSAGAAPIGAARTPDSPGATLRAWRSMHGGRRRQAAFHVYAAVLVAFVVVVPLGRAAWLWLSSAPIAAALQASEAPGLAGSLATGVVLFALVGGRVQGPARRAPALTWALARSAIPRARAFGGPVLGAGAAVTASAMALCVAVGLAVALGGGAVGGGAGGVDAGAIARFTIAGGAVGVIATVAWLTAQAVPRAATIVAVGVTALTAAQVVVGGVIVSPAGLVAASYPTHPATASSAAALAALALLSVTATPHLLRRLTTAALVAHAVRWHAAIASTLHLDLDAAAAAYAPAARHRRLRGTRAVRRVSRPWLAIALRDVIAAIRTPGRLAAGAVAIVLSGVLVVLAVASGAAAWVLGALAGLLALWGLGPVSDGLRHAAHAVADLPMYGLGDGELLAAHAAVPLVFGTVIVVGSALVTAIALHPAAGWAAVLGAVVVVATVLAARIAERLKGPLPPALLTPVPTEVGNVGALARVAWALDAVLLAALAGTALTAAPLVAIAVAGIAAALAAIRFRRRRGGRSAARRRPARTP